MQTPPLTAEQATALTALQQALEQATACDLLAEIAASTSHPDTINQFCDSVDEMARLTAAEAHPAPRG